MNEAAKQWVAALRSGEYEQGRGHLRTGDTFCSLGVACDLYARETGNGSWTEVVGDGTYRFESQNDLNAIELPREVQEWLGLAHAAGEYSDDSLSGLNDNSGASSEEIAEIIESEPKGLFDGGQEGSGRP